MTVTVDDRRQYGRTPICTVKVEATIDVSEDADQVDTTVEANMMVERMVVVIPDLKGTGTCTLTILDADGYTLYSQSGISESTTTYVRRNEDGDPLKVPLSHGTVVRFTTDVDQDVDTSGFVCKMYGR